MTNLVKEKLNKIKILIEETNLLIKEKEEERIKKQNDINKIKIELRKNLSSQKTFKKMRDNKIKQIIGELIINSMENESFDYFEIMQEVKKIIKENDLKIEINNQKRGRKPKNKDLTEKIDKKETELNFDFEDD